MFALFSGMTYAQNFKAHQWKNRLVVIYSDNFHDAQAVRQLDVLFSYQEALTERRIVVYHVTPKGYREGRGEKTIRVNKPYKGPWQFQVDLIGLDGGKKFSSNKVEPIQTFNALIDGMPMRRAEMKRKKG